MNMRVTTNGDTFRLEGECWVTFILVFYERPWWAFLLPWWRPRWVPYTITAPGRREFMPEGIGGMPVKFKTREAAEQECNLIQTAWRTQKLPFVPVDE